MTSYELDFSILIKQPFDLDNLRSEMKRHITDADWVGTYCFEWKGNLVTIRQLESLRYELWDPRTAAALKEYAERDETPSIDYVGQLEVTALHDLVTLEHQVTVARALGNVLMEVGMADIQVAGEAALIDIARIY